MVAKVKLVLFLENHLSHCKHRIFKGLLLTQLPLWHSTERVGNAWRWRSQVQVRT